MRENLLDRMIAIYGFEHPAVIEFAHLCERLDDCAPINYALGVIVKCHEEYPRTDTAD